MNRRLKQIINEAVRNSLLEMDIVPTDHQGNANLVKNQPLNYWRMIYRLMDNVKTAMDATAQDKQSAISMKDVQDIIQYINNSIYNIMK